MAIFTWILLGLGGAALMMAASKPAIRHAVALSDALHLPPFLVGITLVAFGTDMPEIVNSVVSSYLGHGDINVGDSIGSVFTQVTLILGLLPFAVGGAVSVTRRGALLLALHTLVALVIGMWLLRDGHLSRMDAIILVAVWLGAAAIAWRLNGSDPDPETLPAAGGGVLRHLAIAILALAAVGGGAAGLVRAVAGVSASLGIPEYVVSFFGAALGTSLPELVVNLTAVRRGHREIALGGVLGACLLDASISIAAGALLFPTAVTKELAMRGALTAAAAVTVAGLVLITRRKHDRFSGAILIGVYVAGFFVL